METARKLRRKMSYPEGLPWQHLRGAPMGIRFRRQHPIGLDYVADFYCAAVKLVIEVDGQIHDQPEVVVRDATRDAFIALRGLKIIRLLATEILGDADQGAAAVVALASTPLPHRAKRRRGPPPQQAGEDRR
ncbi:endonuclease domain-containing protein [uncultured Sphingomonas sp.]|uniref:endonuclease domain-containing protein n=1 Tax=uncultured Sphingomonas sp. TaxID=158754 RepID=UPI0035CA4D8C